MKPEPHPQSDDDDPSDESPKDLGQGDSNPPEPDADDQAPSSSAFFDLEEGSAFADQETVLISGPRPGGRGVNAPPALGGAATPPDGQAPLRVRNQKHPQPDLPCDLGEVILDDYLSEGGMASVFRGRIKSSGRRVAVKLAFLSRRNADHLRNEIEKLSAINSVNVVHLVDHGENDGLLWAALDLVEGRTLSSLLKSRREGAPISDAFLDLDFDARPRRSKPTNAGPGRIDANSLKRYVRCFAQTARAIDDIARAGCTHRDLSPNNVMIARGGVPVVIDLGLAIDEDDDTSGAYVGTPGYMSPEHATGGYGKIDARSDLYCMSLCFYELITGGPAGKVPSRRDRAQYIHEVLHRSIPPISTQAKGVPASLDPIFAHALENNIERRYQSGAQLAEDLERWLESKGPLFARDDWRARWQRNRAPIAAIFLMALVGSAFWFQAQQDRVNRQRNGAEAATQKELAELRLSIAADSSWEDLTRARSRVAKLEDLNSTEEGRELRSRFANLALGRQAHLQALRTRFTSAQGDIPAELLEESMGLAKTLSGLPEFDRLHREIAIGALPLFVREALRREALPISGIKREKTPTWAEVAETLAPSLPHNHHVLFLRAFWALVDDRPEVAVKLLESPLANRDGLLLHLRLAATHEASAKLRREARASSQQLRGVRLGKIPESELPCPLSEYERVHRALAIAASAAQEAHVAARKSIDDNPDLDNGAIAISYASHVHAQLAERQLRNPPFKIADTARLSALSDRLRDIEESPKSHGLALSASGRLHLLLGRHEESVTAFKRLRNIEGGASVATRLYLIRSLLFAHATMSPRGGGTRADLIDLIRSTLVRAPEGLTFILGGLHLLAIAEKGCAIQESFDLIETATQGVAGLEIDDEALLYLGGTVQVLDNVHDLDALVACGDFLRGLGFFRFRGPRHLGRCVDDARGLIAAARLQKTLDSPDRPPEDAIRDLSAALSLCDGLSEFARGDYDNRVLRFRIAVHLARFSDQADDQSLREEGRSLASTSVLEAGISAELLNTKWQVPPASFEEEEQTIRRYFPKMRDRVVELLGSIDDDTASSNQ